MATLQARLEALASAIGTDIKGLRNMIGILANLTTDAKGNLASSINEVDAHADVIDAKLGGSQTAIGDAVGIVGDRTVVQALQKLYFDIQTLGGDEIINDAAVSGNTGQTYSADKIISLLLASESKILGGMAPETLDTIKELADYLAGEGVAGGIVAQLSKKVDVSLAQMFTTAEQLQGRQNINAASETEFQGLLAGLGAYDTDFAAIYEAAKV